MKFTNQPEKTRDDLPMTPMIDIVFQLLVFFIMTFKIVESEGDFLIKQPTATSSGMETDLPPVVVKLQADADGELANIQVADHSFGKDFGKLKSHMTLLAGNLASSGPDSFDNRPEVEIKPDYQLKYENVVAAMTCVVGTRDNESGEVVPLLNKVRLSRVQRQP